MNNGNSNTGLIAIITAVLIAILAVLVYQSAQKTPAEQVADSVSSTVNQIGDGASN